METSSKKKTVQNGGNDLFLAAVCFFLRRFWRTVKPQQVLLEDQFQFDDDDDDVETRFLDPRRGSSAPFSPPVAEETTRWDGKEYFDEIRRESEQHEEVAR